MCQMISTQELTCVIVLIMPWNWQQLCHLLICFCNWCWNNWYFTLVMRPACSSQFWRENKSRDSSVVQMSHDFCFVADATSGSAQQFSRGLKVPPPSPGGFMAQYDICGPQAHKISKKDWTTSKAIPHGGVDPEAWSTCILFCRVSLSEKLQVPAAGTQDRSLPFLSWDQCKLSDEEILANFMTPSSPTPYTHPWWVISVLWAWLGFLLVFLRLELAK